MLYYAVVLYTKIILSLLIDIPFYLLNSGTTYPNLSVFRSIFFNLNMLLVTIPWLKHKFRFRSRKSNTILLMCMV